MTHRVWGYSAFGLGVVMLLWGIVLQGSLAWPDIVLGAGLVGVLVGMDFSIITGLLVVACNREAVMAHKPMEMTQRRQK